MVTRPDQKIPTTFEDSLGYTITESGILNIYDADRDVIASFKDWSAVAMCPIRRRWQDAITDGIPTASPKLRNVADV